MDAAQEYAQRCQERADQARRALELATITVKESESELADAQHELQLLESELATSEGPPKHNAAALSIWRSHWSRL